MIPLSAPKLMKPWPSMTSTSRLRVTRRAATRAQPRRRSPRRRPNGLVMIPSLFPSRLVGHYFVDFTVVGFRMDLGPEVREKFFDAFLSLGGDSSYFILSKLLRETHMVIWSLFSPSLPPKGGFLMNILHVLIDFALLAVPLPSKRWPHLPGLGVFSPITHGVFMVCGHESCPFAEQTG